MIARLSKIAMCLALAAFALVIAYDNIVDYGSNYGFVRHVLSMDTTFAGNRLMGRAMTSETGWHIAYAAIIAGEAITGILFLVGAAAMWRVRLATAPAFGHAKRWVIAAATMGFLVWFFGFMVIGGEWFAMWESTTWNGQAAAFRFCAVILGVLIYVNQPDADLP